MPKKTKGSQASVDRKAVERGDVMRVKNVEVYLVKSDSGPSWYKVHRWPTIAGSAEDWDCNCLAGQHGTACKHIRRARLMRESNRNV